MPGLYGYVSATKWLSEIELTTREAFDAYWVALGWAKDGPILTESRIDHPSDGAQPGGRTGRHRRARLGAGPRGRERRGPHRRRAVAGGPAQPRHLQGDLGAVDGALAGDAGCAHHRGPRDGRDGRRADRDARRPLAGGRDRVRPGAGVGGLRSGRHRPRQPVAPGERRRGRPTMPSPCAPSTRSAETALGWPALPAQRHHYLRVVHERPGVRQFDASWPQNLGSSCPGQVRPARVRVWLERLSGPWPQGASRRSVW